MYRSDPRYGCVGNSVACQCLVGTLGGAVGLVDGAVGAGAKLGADDVFDVAGGEAVDLFEQGGSAVLDEEVWQADDLEVDVVQVVRVEQFGNGAAEATSDDAILDGDEAAGGAGEVQDEVFIKRLGPAGVDGGDADAFFGAEFTGG